MKTFSKKPTMMAAIAGGILLVATPSLAHPGPGSHASVLTEPIAGERNNYWYDYRSDLEEAEIELGKDLRRAKTAQDRREARAEYNRELIDARKDYMQEMRERGYLRRGEVNVLD